MSWRLSVLKTGVGVAEVDAMSPESTYRLPM
jgi:hypothetical protein